MENPSVFLDAVEKYVRGMDYAHKRSKSQTRMMVQHLVHQYVLSTVFLTISNRRNPHYHDNGFKQGFAWGMHEALAAMGLPWGMLDTIRDTAEEWAKANCPAILDGSNQCHSGCRKCSYIKIPCYCEPEYNNGKHLETCAAYYNLCLCNEPGSPKARGDNHADWCPRHEQR